LSEPGQTQLPKGGDLVRRHRLSTRLWHWTNALALLVLLMSGLMIFNAHPRLYWGEYGANADPAWLEIGSTREGEGFLKIGGLAVETTGVLGVWTDQEGEIRRRAFPWWATIPSNYSLADGRLWHLAFAWLFGLSLVLYLLWSALNGHLGRDLRAARAELAPRHIWQDIKDHARLRFPTGAAALNYNILQKLAYLAVLLVLLPAIVLTGLAMSPGMDASWPWLTQIWGGRQTARSVHFLCALGLVLFVVVHIVMVVLAGPINEVRSMITGNYRLPKEKEVA
jgi:thiosulfate reductase cytochrome b subunit